MSAIELTYQVCPLHFDPRIRPLFVQEAADCSVQHFLQSSRQLRAGRVRTLLQRILRGYLSDYDVNGLLNIYSMHLLSTTQAARLLNRPRGGRLLDIGAGSGDVTSQLAPLFDDVVVTEQSRAMIRRLERRGFRCTRTDVAVDGLPGGTFDVIALLNVLDRCVNPLELLRRCCFAVAPGTQLLVSLPLPYMPHAYSGAQTVDPVVALPIQGASWEQAASSVVTDVLQPLGLHLCRFTRVPYLSAGDSTRPLYVLDAFVACCRTTGRPVGAEYSPLS